MRFIAVIPNYNGAENLGHLIESTSKLGFDDVFVIDDASTDNSLEVLTRYNHQINLIVGDQNLGPAGNRNRILPHLRQNDYITFIDADMEILSKSFRKEVLAVFDQETTVGVVGGLIFSKHGEPMTFNYGYYSNAFRDFFGSTLERLATTLPPLQSILRPLAKSSTYNLEIRFGQPKRQIVDWTSEAFCVVRGDVFKEVGGFNPKLTYHEGQDFARRIYEIGYRVMFWPEMHARHLEYNVRPHRKALWSNWFKLRQQK